MESGEGRRRETEEEQNIMETSARRGEKKIHAWLLEQHCPFVLLLFVLHISWVEKGTIATDFMCYSGEFSIY